MGTSAVEKYLEVIYEIARSGGSTRVKDVAKSLNVSLASVSEMLDRLVQQGYVAHDKYRRITLTPKGKKLAMRLDRKHAVIMRFFTNILEVDEEVANKDACEIEHVISDETLEKLVRFLESVEKSSKSNKTKGK